MVESGRVPGKGRIRASTLKLSRRVSKNVRISMSTRKWLNQCEYRKMVESGRVPRKGRICASNEKLSGRVPKNGRISVSTGKWYNPGEYREKVESVRVPKNYPEEFRKMVESV